MPSLIFNTVHGRTTARELIIAYPPNTGIANRDASTGDVKYATAS